MVKPGIHTSEFAVIVLTIIGNVVAGVSDAINSNASQNISWATVGLAALYALCRTAVKVGSSNGVGNSGGN